VAAALILYYLECGIESYWDAAKEPPA